MRKDFPNEGIVFTFLTTSTYLKPLKCLQIFFTGIVPCLPSRKFVLLIRNSIWSPAQIMNFQISSFFADSKSILDPMDPNSTYTDDWVVQLQNCVFMSIFLYANNTKLEQSPPECCEE